MDHATPKPALGFAIRFHLTDGLGEDGALELWDDFFAGLVEGRGLTCDAGTDTDGLARLLFRPNASATEDDRRAVRETFERRFSAIAMSKNYLRLYAEAIRPASRGADNASKRREKRAARGYRALRA